MIPLTRRERILGELRSKEIVYIEDLAKSIGTSEQTIRRDLMYLEKSGLVERYHGGAAKLIDTRRELSVVQRMQRFSDEKEAIGETAAALIEDGDVIFLDGGTTTAAIVNYIVNKDVTVFTNGMMHIQMLEELDIKTFIVGGEMKRKTGCFIGPIALRTIEKCRFDKVFIGANGVSLEMGCTNADLNESELKTMLVKHGKKAYVVCDSTKFSIESFHNFASLDEVTFITDRLPPEFKNEIKKYILPKTSEA
ncbi:DeoR/GlpR family DNA-binding transcription regulator [Carnobacterium maltaromaticum]|uniref:DeoR/GlpR family DNA-binding transcription regulator n=1 Tax=Carnobacterium maltaromaticum TaxID=2751 RepID=UPI00295E4B45|nr:DeoR/GlpR family DNA-binding transcription regulator [Carnobacterium maltaromaticum]